MLDIVLATDVEIEAINRKLSYATERKDSSDFLNGFPSMSVTWYKKSIDYDCLVDESLYLFWNGAAWGDDNLLPRSLKKGTNDFMLLDAVKNKIKLNEVTTRYLTDIKRLEVDFERNGIRKDEKDFLILVANSLNGPFLILDGNHRAAAALWWSNKDKSSIIDLPKQAWLGISGEMSSYRYYKCVLLAEACGFSGSHD